MLVSTYAGPNPSVSPTDYANRLSTQPTCTRMASQNGSLARLLRRLGLLVNDSSFSLRCTSHACLKATPTLLGTTPKLTDS